MKRAFYLSALLLICSCNTSQTRLTNSYTADLSPNDPPKESITIADFPEPTSVDMYPHLRDAWERFTTDGRYRLARASDMKFSENAKRIINSSFKFWQGDLTFGRELPVLVVDTTHNDETRFGLVIFRPTPRSKTDYTPIGYTPYWLFQGEDLSTTAIDRVSGSLFIHQFYSYGQYDAAEKSCEVLWNEKQKKYICKSMGR